jgi:hypothetical protein
MSEPYAFRLNVFTPEVTLWLGDDGFQVMESGGQTRTYGYDQVSRVRLSYEPSRASADLYFCRIYLKGRNAPALTVSSTYCRGILSFEPQLASYRATVERLHEKLAHKAKAVSYRAGVSNFAYWGNAVFIMISVVFAAVLLIPIAAGITMTGLIWVKLAMIAFLLPLALSWFWANRPRDYDPAAIPSEVLPGT